MTLRSNLIVFTLAALLAGPVLADEYYLLVGVDETLYPGAERFIFGPGGTPGAVYDGDRLAGTADVGPVVPYAGTGTPLHPANYLGSLSMLYRRGTIPFAGGIPILGIEFLGGPLLDLDGDPNDPNRALIPNLVDDPVDIPWTDSFIDLDPNFTAGTITLNNIDASGTNEGGPGVGPDVTNILINIAGRQPDGTLGASPNPTIDTRVGTLAAFTGTSGTLSTVYQISDLGYEIWEDSADPTSSTAGDLGTMQFLGAFSGWLVERDPNGNFPVLSGEGLGATGWPAVNTAVIGQSYNTAFGFPAPTATILGNVSGDDYTYISAAPNNFDGNGGQPLMDMGGDLGAYFDQVVIPLLPAAADQFVYLESVGWGINASGDPVFTDTVCYDVVIIAATASCRGFEPGDTNCNGEIGFDDINPFVDALVAGESGWRASDLATTYCPFNCVNDVDQDGVVGFGDINPFVALLTGK